MIQNLKIFHVSKRKLLHLDHRRLSNISMNSNSQCDMLFKAWSFHYTILFQISSKILEYRNKSLFFGLKFIFQQIESKFRRNIQTELFRKQRKDGVTFPHKPIS